jgi:phosphohistidine phosphatase
MPMKTLYLVRHAKASRDEKGIKDWERPLTVTGIYRAQQIAKKLYDKKILPGRMVSSHAFRSLNTALIFAINLRYPVSALDISSSLYEKKAADILDMLKKQDDTIISIMLFGHNPSISDLCDILTRKKGNDLPTSAVICLQFKTNKWSDIGKLAGKIVFTELGK